MTDLSVCLRKKIGGWIRGQALWIQPWPGEYSLKSCIPGTLVLFALCVCHLQWLIFLRVTNILPSFVNCASGHRRGFSNCESVQMYRKNIKNSIINLSLLYHLSSKVVNNCFFFLSHFKVNYRCYDTLHVNASVHRPQMRAFRSILSSRTKRIVMLEY